MNRFARVPVCGEAAWRTRPSPMHVISGREPLNVAAWIAVPSASVRQAVGEVTDSFVNAYLAANTKSQ